MLKTLSVAVAEINQDNFRYFFAGHNLMKLNRIVLAKRSREEEFSIDVDKVCSIDEIDSFTITDDGLIVYLNDSYSQPIWL